MEMILERLDAASRFDLDRVSYESRLPFGGRAHRLLGKLVRRQLEGVALELREYAAAVRSSVIELAEIMSQARMEQQARLEAVVDQFERRARWVGPAPGIESIAILLEGLTPALILGSTPAAVRSALGEPKAEAGIEQLRARADGSLGAIVSGSLEDALPALAYQKLRPGGRLLVAGWDVPIAQSSFAAGQAGFASVDADWLPATGAVVAATR
jgi:hypothetical protein